MEATELKFDVKSSIRELSGNLGPSKMKRYCPRIWLSTPRPSHTETPKDILTYSSVFAIGVAVCLPTYFVS